VVTTEGNAAMTQTLPSLLKEVRQVVGAQAKPTIVFDRGGFCGKLFGDIVKDGFDFITYRKGNYEAFATENALEVTIRRDGKERCVKAWDSRVELKEYGSIRCVAVLRSDGKQTHVLTSREDLSIREVLERMFSRWQQENFFKYLGEEFAFDALWTYGADQANSERTVANPKRNALSEQIATLRRQIAEHQKTPSLPT
jgi:Transposase DDE domain